jgi:serine/threonine protein kinase
MSILEFLVACRDIVKGLRSLHQDGKILHRDICIKNLIIASKSSQGDAEEVLIDLDGALDLEKDPARRGELIGSEGFMAIGILNGDPHTYRHAWSLYSMSFYGLLFATTTNTMIENH